jgi:hypothetical protein
MTFDMWEIGELTRSARGRIVSNAPENNCFGAPTVLPPLKGELEFLHRSLLATY